MYKLIKANRLFFPLSSKKNKTYICPILGSKKDFNECLRVGNGWRYFENLKVIQIVSGNFYQSIFHYKEFLSLAKKSSKKCENFSKNVINNLIKKRKINAKLNLSKCNVMGVINLKTNSFYNPSIVNDLETFRKIIELMQLYNVDIIDFGGESTKPGEKKISQKNEIKRIKIFLDEFNSLKLNCIISLDTRNVQTMKEAIKYGISIINDISGFSDKKAINLLKENDVTGVVMHMQGNPEKIQENPKYRFPPTDIFDFFENKINKLIEYGVDFSKIVIDPGFGFGKKLEDNLFLLKYLPMFHCLGVPILVGLSRKSFIEEISRKRFKKINNCNLDLTAENRLGGSIGLVARVYDSGVQFVRTHDVFDTKQAIFCLEEIDTIG